MSADQELRLNALHYDFDKLEQRVKNLELQVKTILERLSYYQQIVDSRLRKIEREVVNNGNERRRTKKV